MTKKIEVIKPTDFAARVLGHTLPILVFFIEEHSKQAKLFAQNLEQLAREFHGVVDIVKVDITESPTIASTYSVTKAPTNIMFKAGVAHGTKVGVSTRTDLRKFINLHR